MDDCGHVNKEGELNTVKRLLIIALLLTTGCATSQILIGHGATDIVRPGPMTLTVYDYDTTTVSLRWIAVGDDSLSGRAISYTVRYNTDSITTANWGSSTNVADEPTPKNAGKYDSLTVTGLASGTKYYFALMSVDDGGNESALSSVPNATTMTPSEGGEWEIDTTKAYVDDYSGLTDYHVATTGDDDNDGSSLEQAWLTIGKANSTLTAGDRVLIHAGTYTQPIAPANSGSSGSPIVYQAYGTDVCSLYCTSTPIQWASKHYIHIVGIAAQLAPNTYDDVVDVSTSNHVLFKSCRIYGGTMNDIQGTTYQSAKFTSVTYLRFVGNLIDRQDPVITDGNSVGANPDWRGDGLAVKDSASRYVIVEGNTVRNVSHYGMDVPSARLNDALGIRQPAYFAVRNNTIYDSHVGFGGNTWNQRVLYEGNRSYSPGQAAYRGGVSWEITSSKALLRYNMVYDDSIAADGGNHNPGSNNSIMSQTWYIPSYENRYVHNVLMGISRTPVERYSAYSINNSDETADWGRSVWVNNIIAYPNNGYDSHPFYWQDDWGGFSDTLRGNLVWSQTVGDTVFRHSGTGYFTLAQAKSSYAGWESTNFEATPLWVDSLSLRGSRSFELSESSPCVDAGIALTTVASDVSSSTVVPVGDAAFFHYDWGANPYDRGDSVLIGNAHAEIDSIDYDNNRLILKSAISIDAGTGIHVLATYETLRGYVRRLFGTAPDVGPYENR